MVKQRDKSVCAGSCFADVNIFWLSHFQLVDGGCPERVFAFLHFLRDAGIWKAHTFQ